MYKNTARPTVRRTVAGDRYGLRVIAEARRSRIGQHHETGLLAATGCR